MTMSLMYSHKYRMFLHDKGIIIQKNKKIIKAYYNIPQNKLNEDKLLSVKVFKRWDDEINTFIIF